MIDDGVGVKAGIKDRKSNLDKRVNVIRLTQSTGRFSIAAV